MIGLEENKMLLSKWNVLETYGNGRYSYFMSKVATLTEVEAGFNRLALVSVGGKEPWSWPQLRRTS